MENLWNDIEQSAAQQNVEDRRVWTSLSKYQIVNVIEENWSDSYDLKSEGCAEFFEDGEDVEYSRFDLYTWNDDSDSEEYTHSVTIYSYVQTSDVTG